jgi:hypothetical protein
MIVVEPTCKASPLKLSLEAAASQNDKAKAE